MYETLNLSEEDKEDISQIIAALQTFAKGVINETTERHMCMKTERRISFQWFFDRPDNN